MITQEEFDALLANPAKQVRGDVMWTTDREGSPAVRFRVAVQTDPPCPLSVVGRFNPNAGKATDSGDGAVPAAESGSEGGLTA